MTNNTTTITKEQLTAHVRAKLERVTVFSLPETLPQKQKQDALMNKRILELAMDALTVQPALSQIIERLNQSGYEYSNAAIDEASATAVIDILLHQLNDAVVAQNYAQPAEPVYQFRLRNSYNGDVTYWQTIKREHVDTVIKEYPHNAEFRIVPAYAPDIVNDVRAVVQLLSEGEWAEHCTKTELGQQLEVEVTKLVGAKPIVPDGWKLVPIVPTEDMIIAGFQSEPDEFFSPPEVWEEYSQLMPGCHQAAYRAKLCWCTMIEKSPNHSAQEGRQ